MPQLRAEREGERCPSHAYVCIYYKTTLYNKKYKYIINIKFLIYKKTIHRYKRIKTKLNRCSSSLVT